MTDLENKEVGEEETEECIDWAETQKQGKIVKTRRKKEKKEVVDYDLFIPGDNVRGTSYNQKKLTDEQKKELEEVSFNSCTNIFTNLSLAVLIAFLAFIIGFFREFGEDITSKQMIIMGITLLLTNIFIFTVYLIIANVLAPTLTLNGKNTLSFIRAMIIFVLIDLDVLIEFIIMRSLVMIIALSIFLAILIIVFTVIICINYKKK